MVAPGGGEGHAWLLWGGMHGCSGGACVVAPGGGHAWLLGGGVCGFIRRGHAWFYLGGGMRGVFSFSGYNEIRSMSGRYASYWNAFLFSLNFAQFELNTTSLVPFKRYLGDVRTQTRIQKY